MIYLKIKKEVNYLLIANSMINIILIKTITKWIIKFII